MKNNRERNSQADNKLGPFLFISEYASLMPNWAKYSSGLIYEWFFNGYKQTVYGILMLDGQFAIHINSLALCVAKDKKRFTMYFSCINLDEEIVV